MFKKTIFLLIILCSGCGARAQKDQALRLVRQSELQTAAQQTGEYFPFLKGKKVAVVANHSSKIGRTHLVDSLMNAGIEIGCIFTPEHGFRGTADAGEKVATTTDPLSGIQVYSLYGDKKKPDAVMLQGIEVVCFDLQDVGVRFYTYISTLTYVMEACAEHDIPIVVLDRPNPNGFYVDGPVLEPAFRSFVGLHPVPVVYGLTIGEYAMMVNGEGWLKNGLQCKLTVVKLKGYDRNMIVMLEEKPSPNLASWEAVYLYPSLCLFEGTVVSVGRGTPTPFEVFGHPDMTAAQFNYSFKPQPMPGAKEPKLNGKTCRGKNLKPHAAAFRQNPRQLQLAWLTEAWQSLKDKDGFFNNYFNTLAGTARLRSQIETGISEEAIRAQWQPGLDAYKKIRAKYLLYPD